MYETFDYNNDFFDDPTLRERLIRQTTDQILWDPEESIDSDLLEDY